MISLLYVDSYIVWCFTALETNAVTKGLWIILRIYNGHINIVEHSSIHFGQVWTRSFDRPFERWVKNS